VRTGSRGLARRDESTDLTTQHRDLVAQDQDLDVLGSGAAGEQPQPAEHRDTDQIQQSKQHGPRSCHDHRDATKHQVTTRVMNFGTVQVPTAI
jgi:hypothetical protein